MDSVDKTHASRERPPGKSEDEAQGTSSHRQIPVSFSMAHALSMIRQRQKEQQQAKQESEVDLDEQKKAKARAKRQRRRQNQKIAKLRAAEAKGDDTQGSSQDGDDEPNKAPDRGHSSANLKRACDEEDKDSMLRLPVKKRLKLVAAEEKQDTAAQVEVVEATSEASSSKAHMKFIPRALLIKKKTKQTDNR